MNNIYRQLISHIREIFLLQEIVDEYEQLPYKGEPNSFVKKETPDKRIIQIRCYGPDGYAYCDYDFNDHGYKESHNYPKHNGAHKHICEPDKRINELYHGIRQPLTDKEYEKYVLNHRKIKAKIIPVKYL